MLSLGTGAAVSGQSEKDSYFKEKTIPVKDITKAIKTPHPTRMPSG